MESVSFEARVRAARMLAAIFAAAILGGCATTTLTGAVDPPRYVVGDRWEYRVVDGLTPMAPVVTLDCEVIAVTPSNTLLRVTYNDARGARQHIEELAPDASVRIGSLGTSETRSFEPPARELAFPLVQGETWRQTLANVHERDGSRGEVLLYGRVLGREPVTVSAGNYDAVVMYRIVQLDDEQFWRSRTERRDQIWYSPKVKAVVREVRDGQYREKGQGIDSSYVRTEYTIYELVAFRPGAAS